MSKIIERAQDALNRGADSRFTIEDETVDITLLLEKLLSKGLPSILT
jgi:hypothetical protein